jgi:hypothetical protein
MTLSGSSICRYREFARTVWIDKKGHDFTNKSLLPPAAKKKSFWIRS